MCNISFCPPKYPYEVGVIISPLTWTNKKRLLEILRSISKITQMERGASRIWTPQCQILWPDSLCNTMETQESPSEERSLPISLGKWEVIRDTESRMLTIKWQREAQMDRGLFVGVADLDLSLQIWVICLSSDVLCSKAIEVLVLDQPPWVWALSL